MMDDRIPRKAVRDGMMKYSFHAPDMTVHEFVEDEHHSVTAVPLDKLCEWLAGNAWAFDCRDCEEYCEAVIGCKNEVGSSPEYWADKLTKWMEGLDGNE